MKLRCAAQDSLGGRFWLGRRRCNASATHSKAYLMVGSSPDKRVRAAVREHAGAELSEYRSFTVEYETLAGASDYTQHRDPARKQQYLARHAPREHWENPMTAGALARWILWNKETLHSSIQDYTRRFNLTAV